MTRPLRERDGLVNGTSRRPVPALQLKFRQEYSTMTEADIEVLVNDALEKGLHQEVGRQRLDPKSPPIYCMGPYRRRTLFPNCY